MVTEPTSARRAQAENEEGVGPIGGAGGTPPSLLRVFVPVASPRLRLIIDSG